MVEAHAPPPALAGESVVEDLVLHVIGNAAALVLHRYEELAGLGEHAEGQFPRLGGEARVKRHLHVHRVQRVVNQVPDNRDEGLGRQLYVRALEAYALLEYELDVALRGAGNLSDEQGSEGGVVHRMHDPAQCLPLYNRDVLDIRYRLVVFPDLDEPQYDVQLVGKVVVVRPHGIDQVLGAGQIFHQLGVFRTVVQEGDRAFYPAVLLDRDAVDQQLRPAFRLLVHARKALARCQRLEEELLGKEPSVNEGVLALLVAAEYLLCDPVDELNLLLVVNRDDALVD